MIVWSVRLLATSWQSLLLAIEVAAQPPPAFEFFDRPRVQPHSKPGYSKPG